MMVNIKIEQKDYIAIITIDRQQALNALNRELLNQLKELLNNINYETTRCLILTGAGEKAFVAGADIAYMKTLSKKQAEEFSIIGNSIFNKIEHLPIPVIAAVNGFALGGGCELALACDIRIASENAVFSQPEVSLGIIPGFGGTFRLSRLVGEGIAKELLFTGDRVKAPRALEIGLVNAVYTLPELLEKAIEMGEKICKNSPIGVSAIKSVMYEVQKADIYGKMYAEAEYFGNCFETEDQKEAMTAMLEKRPAKPFTGK